MPTPQSNPTTNPSPHFSIITQKHTTNPFTTPHMIAHSTTPHPSISPHTRCIRRLRPHMQTQPIPGAPASGRRQHRAAIGWASSVGRARRPTSTHLCGVSANRSAARCTLERAPGKAFSRVMSAGYYCSFGSVFSFLLSGSTRTKGELLLLLVGSLALAKPHCRPNTRPERASLLILVFAVLLGLRCETL